MTTTTERPRRRYAKTAQRRADIVDAAMTVFAARGYHGGSLRDIARELDLSVTSLVHHFPSKSDLLAAVLEHADEQAGWAEESFELAGVRETIMQLWDFNSGHPELLRLLAMVAAEASAEDHPAHAWFVSRYRRIVEGLGEAIERDQSRGMARSDSDVVDLARAITAAWDGLQLQWLIDPSRDHATALRLSLDRILGADDDPAGEG